jgi:hypothetical protein
MYLLWFNFLQNDWQPKNVIIDLFEVTKNTTHVLVQSMIDLLEKYGPKKIIIYVKDERSNFNVMTSVMKLVVSCESFDFEK